MTPRSGSEGSLVKTKNEFYNRMQVVFCCLYYRCHYYSEEMIQALIEELNPQVIRLTTHDTKEIGKRFQILQTEIATRHMQLATFFVKRTERGQAYTEEATRSRGNKIKIPQLSSNEILEVLQLTSGALRLLWMPIVPIVTGEWTVSAGTGGSDLGDYAAYFRTFTGNFVGIIARLYTDRMAQFSTSAQVTFFSANSHPKVDREWPNWNLETSAVKLYQNGVFLTERDRQRFSAYIAQISVIAGTTPEREHDRNLAGENDNDGGRIFSALNEEAEEITGRPMEFGSEFCETGGIGMPKEVMEDILSLDKPYVAGLVGTLHQTAQRLENPEIEIAEIASLANVGVRGLARYTMERILAESRVICDAIYDYETALKENKARLTEVGHALAEQEKKVEWFRKQRDKFHLTNAELEEKNRELDESMKKIGAHDEGGTSWGDRIGSKLTVDDWMDQIIPAGLQHPANVGWAQNQSVSHGPQAEVATSSPTTPLGIRMVPSDEMPVIHKPQLERSSRVEGLGTVSGLVRDLAGLPPSNLFTKATDTLSPMSLREIMGDGNPTAREPVTDPIEHLPNDDDNTLPADK
jgi:hypothetical protein